MKKFYSEAFKNDFFLEKVIDHSSVTVIGNKAFYECTSLSEVIFRSSPSSHLIIKDYSFYGCSALTSIAIPSHVTEIGNASFGN